MNTTSDSSLPLVSCIMPTRNRRWAVPRAIQYFLHQDYPNRELLIVDDGTDRIGDLIPGDSRIRYFELPRPASTGAKRNFACTNSKGTLIAHWDDDDWYAPWRLTYQVEQLLQANADICGLDRVLFYAPKRKKRGNMSIRPNSGVGYTARVSVTHGRFLRLILSPIFA